MRFLERVKREPYLDLCAFLLAQLGEGIDDDTEHDVQTNNVDDDEHGHVEDEKLSGLLIPVEVRRVHGISQACSEESRPEVYDNLRINK